MMVKPQPPWLAYRAHHVHPGDVHVSAEPDVVISTLLGSCVAACLFDPTSGVGGLNHFLLPDGEGTLLYGTHAMETLVNGILRQGGRRGSIRAKAFGGAQMKRGSSVLGIGRRNGDFIRLYLANEGIPLLAQDLGGASARRVWFHPGSGRVWVEALAGHAVDPLAQQERRYREGITTTPVAGDIEIFS
jgi:chemotaxis protein CheD